MKAFLIFLIAALFFSPAIPSRQAIAEDISTSVLYFTQSEDNGAFAITARVNPNGGNINAVGAIIQYDPNQVEITSIDTTNSFCKFFPENTFDNPIGEARIMCGLPFPGIYTDSEIAKINFKKLQNINVYVDYSTESSVLANDGYGTNILDRAEGIEF